MRIATDVRALTKQPTGTGYYLKNLLDEFAQSEDDNIYYLCCSCIQKFTVQQYQK